MFFKLFNFFFYKNKKKMSKFNKTNFVIEMSLNWVDGPTLLKELYKNHNHEVKRKKDSYIKKNITKTDTELKHQLSAELTAVFSNKKDFFDCDETQQYKRWKLNQKGLDYYNQNIKPKVVIQQNITKVVNPLVNILNSNQLIDCINTNLSKLDKAQIEKLREIVSEIY